MVKSYFENPNSNTYLFLPYFHPSAGYQFDTKNDDHIKLAHKI